LNLYNSVTTPFVFQHQSAPGAIKPDWHGCYQVLNTKTGYPVLTECYAERYKAKMV